MSTSSEREINHIKRVNDILIFIQQQPKADKIGLLYNKFCDKHGDFCFSFKTFQRAIEELVERELIHVKKTMGGIHGNTTIVSKDPIGDD